MKSLLIIAAGIMILVLVAFKYSDTENPKVKNEGIQFQTGSWEQALVLAKNENKPLFLDISTSWCGYCKRMKANVFTNNEVGNYFNAEFINVSIDAEVGEGIELARKYGVKGYPTFVFLNPDGSLFKQTAGYRNSEQFLELSKSITTKK